LTLDPDGATVGLPGPFLSGGVGFGAPHYEVVSPLVAALAVEELLLRRYRRRVVKGKEWLALRPRDVWRIINFLDSRYLKTTSSLGVWDGLNCRYKPTFKALDHLPRR